MNSFWSFYLTFWSKSPINRRLTTKQRPTRESKGNSVPVYWGLEEKLLWNFFLHRVLHIILVGLGIWRTYNRAMTLHAVNNATFEWNVAYNNMGHAYFTEDGVETGNWIQYNLAIKTKPSSSLLSVDQTPTSFWIVNAANHIIGNRAAGAAGFGFWVNPPPHSTGSNVNNKYCPRHGSE